MLSELFSGFITMDSQGNIVHSNQQSTERKMPVTANQMFHLAKSKEDECRKEWIESIEEDIRSKSSEGFFRTYKYFGRSSSFYIAAVKEHFTKLGFDVTEEKDEDGDNQLVFSWENAKEAQPSA